MVHDMYVYEVKKPVRVEGRVGLTTSCAVIPGDQAFRPLSESTCPLVKK